MNLDKPLNLDARQRAMLAEMGVRVWSPPQPQALGEADTSVSIAEKHHLTLARAEKESKNAARAAQGGASAGEPLRPHEWDRTAPAHRLEPPAAARQNVPPPAPVATRPSARPAAPVQRGPLPHGIDTMDWPALEDAVAGCGACGLCEGRTQAVLGVGDRSADWMVIGEAPGEEEDRRGEPFVGPSGQLLDNMLKAVGLSRQVHAPDAEADAGRSASGGVYIANVIKCRPPGNRNPQPDEVAQCSAYLARQVALVRPRIILALGRFAVNALLNTDEPLGRLRGRVYDYQGVSVIVSYHPAYLLRSLPEKAKAWADLCLALEQLQGLPPR